MVDGVFRQRNDGGNFAAGLSSGGPPQTFYFPVVEVMGSVAGALRSECFDLVKQTLEIQKQIWIKETDFLIAGKQHQEGTSFAFGGGWKTVSEVDVQLLCQQWTGTAILLGVARFLIVKLINIFLNSVILRPDKWC